MKDSFERNVVSFVPISPRVAVLMLRFENKQTLKLVQVYAPTSTHSDVVYDQFLDTVMMALNSYRSDHTVILGDFNAKIGTKEPGESSLGVFGFGSRNERGQKLVTFCENIGLSIMNTFFKARDERKWTWRGPNGMVKNEIDFVITKSKGQVRRVSVLKRFATGSDHRLLRTDLTFWKSRRWIGNQRANCRTELDRTAYHIAISRAMNASQSTEYEDIVGAIRQAEDAATVSVPAQSKLSDRTKRMLALRREMKMNNANQTVEFAETRKLTGEMMKEDKQKFN